MATIDPTNPPMYGPFFGSLGVTAAMAFSACGAAYGTARAGSSIAGACVFRPDLVMRSLIPVIMAGIVAIYGLVVAVILGSSLQQSHGDAGYQYTAAKGFAQLTAGVVCGLCGVSSGWCIGVIGDYGVRAFVVEPRFFVTMVLMLIFAEVLGLYGMIVALVMNNADTGAK